MSLPTFAATMGQILSPDASPWDLAPVFAAFVVPILGLTVTLMRYQHTDSTKTRDLIERAARETAKQFERAAEATAKQFERAARETAKQFERAAEATAKRFEQVDKQFEQVDKRFEQVDKQFEQVDKQFDLMRADIRYIGDGLNDARDRLARIEGCLDTTRPQTDDNHDQNSRDAA